MDNVEQLKKVFIYDYSKFFTVAKDVKVQVEFNPQIVESYRLIGYENRMLNQEDFEDDSKDTGEIGSDQDITALYEIVHKENPAYKTIPTFTIDFRYKEPASSESVPLELDIFDKGNTFQQASDYMKFSASIASFGMMLTDSQYKGSSNYSEINDWLNAVELNDENGFKSEFRTLVKTADGLN